MEVRTVVC